MRYFKRMSPWITVPASVVIIFAIAFGAGWTARGSDTEVVTQEVQVTPVGPTQAELKAQKCAAALQALGNWQPAVQERVITFLPTQLTDAVDRYCD